MTHRHLTEAAATGASPPSPLSVKRRGGAWMLLVSRELAYVGTA